MEAGRLNNFGDHTSSGDDGNLECLLSGNGKGEGGKKLVSTEKKPSKKRKRPKKKSSVLQAKLNHLAGLIGQVGEFGSSLLNDL